jgi:hypothetical protein
MLSIGGGGRGSRQPHIGEAELDVGAVEGEAVAAGGGREIRRLHAGEAKLGVGTTRARQLRERQPAMRGQQLQEMEEVQCNIPNFKQKENELPFSKFWNQQKLLFLV